jgi:hypothetical protein
VTVRALAADLALGDHVCLPFESDHDKLRFAAAFADVAAVRALAMAAAARGRFDTTIWCAEPLARLLTLLGATGVATVSVRAGSHG